MFWLAVYRSGLSTYKELCAIANDLNQPDLIYKFMHLANHNASWNTRKVSQLPRVQPCFQFLLCWEIALNRNRTCTLLGFRFRLSLIHI